MKPVPVNAIGHFQERAVAASLQSSFAAIWIHQLPKEDMPPVIVAPDGTIDLQWIDGVLRVAGPDRDPKTEVIPAGATVIGFRFRPAVAARWLGIPASELVGQRLELEDLWGSKARRLTRKVSLRGIGVIEALEAAFANVMPGRLGDAAMSAAYTLIEAGPPSGARLVPWLARSLAMSERTLRRRFAESFGYGPKTLDRILRYRRFLRLSRTSQSPIAVIAAEAGYADQAHLVRECKRLSSVTPKDVVAYQPHDVRRGLSARDAGDRVRRP